MLRHLGCNVVYELRLGILDVTAKSEQFAIQLQHEDPPGSRFDSPVDRVLKLHLRPHGVNVIGQRRIGSADDSRRGPRRPRKIRRYPRVISGCD